ncbi:subunit of the baculovirus polymerase [Alphabaculovirus altersperidaniae]|uniref:Subunit of the baculovirus polymerase n=1 Tax=Spodoptera eridania nucleopolyhedrovirus TaxID=2315721 RepID=A0ABX6TR10_9ABAC|nr:subunit of the baculovirus polymerase [Spodoptera eridania nucleopolyhedrovirus]QNV47835.1 subunit of the baculovirus polymerase [Spodoptera eridania nucleopolyhedrovirus]
MTFARFFVTRSQPLPQCCKYLADPLALYLLYATGQNHEATQTRYVLENTIEVDDDGFVVLQQSCVYFDLDCLFAATPKDLNCYVDATRKSMSGHDKRIFKLLVHDRWCKGDTVRLRKMLLQRDVSKLIAFACNVVWERGYENHYTLGQQLSIRITTKLIQSGLDFKHQQDSDNVSVAVETVPGRGWNNKALEKLIGNITSISDVIKRHKSASKYIVLEIDPINCDAVKKCLSDHQFSLIHNVHVETACAIRVDDDKNSLQYLVKLSKLIADRLINVLFVTDVEFYLKHNNYKFYLYNSLKFYYYCLRNKFVFEYKDYEIIFLLNLIVSLEWHNNGHLNSFTLEKSQIYNPLELSTRRLNSIKRAAAQSRVINNDNEIKIDFIKGKRMKMGTHYGQRIIDLND